MYGVWEFIWGEIPSTTDPLALLFNYITESTQGGQRRDDPSEGGEMKLK